MKFTTILIASTLLVSAFGFNNNAKANESLTNTIDQQNHPEMLMAQVGAEVSVDPLAIANTVMERVGAANNREGFVKSVSEEIWQAYGQQYNVMVFNLNQEYDSRINQVDYQTVNYDGIPYGVWIFEEGEFTNKGDGGYINWAFKGQFERDGSYVKFN